VPILDRRDLGGGRQLAGPAIVTDSVATTWVAQGWSARLDRVGNLRLRRT
jgi:N-methylhydantoinase A